MRVRAWPVLAVAGLLLAGGVTLDVVTDAPALAVALVTLSAACLGAFLYAEGRRPPD